LPLKSIHADTILSCIVPCNQLIGVIALNQEGLLRFWETITLQDQYKELELELDSEPLFMVACDVSDTVIFF
jgi:hypothetical protein